MAFPLCLRHHGPSFALNLTRFQEGPWDWKRAFVVNQTANVAWIGSTVLGGARRNLPSAGAFGGMDFALPAMFLCLLVFSSRGLSTSPPPCSPGGSAVVLSLLFGERAHHPASLLGATKEDDPLCLSEKGFSRGRGKEEKEQ